MKNLLKINWISSKNSLLLTGIISTIITITVYFLAFVIAPNPASSILLNIYFALVMFYIVYFIYFTNIYSDLTDSYQRVIFSLPIKRRDYLLLKYLIFLFGYFIILLYHILLSWILSIATSTTFILYPSLILIGFLYSLLFVVSFFISVLSLPFETSKGFISTIGMIYYLIPISLTSEKVRNNIINIIDSNFNIFTFYIVIIITIIYIGSFIINLKLIERKSF
ncbi:MAG: ABC-2 transporter permease [Clostridium sp.]|uniref:ABC-2 transporter permease n=1 Tax=Clostridium sp. TaxID=1506 RepID=UPI002FCB569A